MQAAGERTAQLILQRFPDVRTGGAVIYAGSGNNGGDAYVVARVLAEARCPLRIVASAEPTTDDARRARDAALPRVAEVSEPQRPAAIIDGLLGVGTKGEIRAELVPLIAAIAEWHQQGARVVALDIPSGIDASSGAGGSTVRADLTVTYGTVKRGILLRRDECGEIVCLDIGLGAYALLDDGAPQAG